MRDFFKEGDCDIIGRSGQFKPGDCQWDFSISLDKANRLIRERVTVEDTMSGPKLYTLDSSYFETPDTAEQILRDFKAKCEKLEFHPNSFTHLDLSDLYERAKKLLSEGKK